ncbi:MAG: M24 family metallopeptidase [Candidatus Hermodarchaeota archaeon]
MIEELDSELEKIDAEAILITGTSTFGNPSLKYVCGEHIARGGLYAKKVGKEPILVVGDLDIANAKKGLVKDVRPISHYNYDKQVSEHGVGEARAIVYNKVLQELGVQKKIVLGGMNEAGNVIDIARRLEKFGFDIIADPDIVGRVRRTKNPRELELISRIAQRTESVVRETLEMLRNCSLSSNIVQYKQGPLTVTDVKTYINLQLAKKNLVASLDTIFAPGPDGADPHNHGTPTRKIKAGIPIVFDIFPQDVESGYCFDTTRTFVIGKAPKEVKTMYEDVVVSQRSALDQIKAGANGQEISRTVCKILEERNHKTPVYYMKHKGLAMTEGFIHGLGHGVGLTIGEPPSLSLGVEYILKEGDVVTVEPGVYYPGKWGIRIEDTVAVEASGYRNFSTLEKTLEL